MRHLTKLGVLILIRSYQLFLSPVLPPACRFYPTCSAYAYEAVEKWGVGRGGWLALRRLLKCHPLGKQGYDPVP
ncbi:MAG TPA: membrane protein insertion efficiency factor YidD [Terriglobia bacterium]|nr:membrane protein insertion efficiency factor YidD [Terriglobia bacterium]